MGLFNMFRSECGVILELMLNVVIANLTILKKIYSTLKVNIDTSLSTKKRKFHEKKVYICVYVCTYKVSASILFPNTYYKRESFKTLSRQK